jgi:hypothetical protein
MNVSGESKPFLRLFLLKSSISFFLFYEDLGDHMLRRIQTKGKRN